MKVTREQRFLLMRAGHPRIAFDGKKPCPVKVGHVQRLSPRVELEVTGIQRTKKGEWVIEYLVRDDRPNLLRRTPQVHRFKADERGYVAPPTLGDIEAARLDSSYTHSTHGAITDAGEAVPDVDQNLLSMRAKTKWAEREQTERPEEVARRVARTVAAQVKEVAVLQARSGVDPQPFLADLQRRLAEQRDLAA